MSLTEILILAIFGSICMFFVAVDTENKKITKEQTIELKHHIDSVLTVKLNQNGRIRKSL